MHSRSFPRSNGSTKVFWRRSIFLKLYITIICLINIFYNYIHTLQCNIPDKTIDDEAQEYVVGYVAKRFIAKYPNLGQKTEQLHESEAASSWIQLMSKGNLITPSNELILAAKYMEAEFEKYMAKK